jgi:four helix bundle protein
MQDFRNLKVWEKAHALTLDIYKASKSFPREEMYGLTSQIRRASVSIGSNIAGGSCRKGDAEFARFLQMAAGSASEVEYQLLLTRDLEFLRIADYQRVSDEVVEVKRMLAALMQKLRADS